MSALHAASALLAAADVNVELAVNRPTRNLDLVLLIDVRLVDVAATSGTLLGQRRLVDLVDLLRRLAVSLGAVIFAGLAAGLLRLWRGRSFGERRGLAFTGPALLFEKTRKMLDLCAEFGDCALEPETVETGSFSHTFTLAGA
jgi:hypothetical protein